MPSPPLLQRLKERKLVQWGLAYLAGAFVVFQLLDALEEPLGLTTAIQQGVLAVVVVGFFITLVLAWYHGEKGRQRVSGPELLMVSALLVVAGVALSVLPGGEEPRGLTETAAIAPVDDDRPSIAVLPFDDFSPNPDDAYFANGMHEEIISKLSRIAALRVISRNSVMQYREERRTTPEVALELGVDFVLEGSARVAGEQVRLTAQLIRARPEEHLWTNDYDQELSVENLISTQSDIAQQVAQSVGAVLTLDEEARIEAVPTENLKAYEAYLLGSYHLWRRDDPANAFSEAVRYFQTAIQQDPDLAAAHAGLAIAYYQMASWSVGDPREIWPQVERWARSALAIDSTNAYAHLMWANSRLIRTWDWEGVERAFQRAIELNPSDPLGYAHYAYLLIAQGKIEEGLREGRTAAALDPLSSSTLYRQALCVFLSRNYEEAGQLVEDLLTTDPDNLMAAYFLALSSIYGGHPEQAARLFPDRPTDTDKLAPADRAIEAFSLSLLGEAESARQEIDEAVSGSADQYINPLAVWGTYAALGDPDQAFFWLERSIEEMSPLNWFLGVIPVADPLRGDPRYQLILDRIGLGHLKARFDSLAAGASGGGT